MVKTKVLYLTVGVIAAAAFLGLYAINAIASPIEVGTHYVIDFSPDLPQNVTIKRGETQTVPVNVMVPEGKAVTLKATVTELEENSTLLSAQERFKDRASEGLSVHLDKKDIVLEAISNGDTVMQAARDKLAMTITAGPEASTGIHRFGITLQNTVDEGFKTRYFNVIVVE